MLARPQRVENRCALQLLYLSHPIHTFTPNKPNSMDPPEFWNDIKEGRGWDRLQQMAAQLQQQPRAPAYGPISNRRAPSPPARNDDNSPARLAAGQQQQQQQQQEEGFESPDYAPSSPAESENGEKEAVSHVLISKETLT